MDIELDDLNDDESLETYNDEDTMTMLKISKQSSHLLNEQPNNFNLNLNLNNNNNNNNNNNHKNSDNFSIINNNSNLT